MAAPQKLLFAMLFFIAIFILSGNLLGVHGSSHRLNYKPTKLFVFGDSYVDAGNSPKSSSSSWMLPYGITFPGVPAGRWSNGRVWSDFFANFLGLKSPIPYELSNGGTKHIKHGMNFAYGGTGVFDTLSTSPNMTIQIDYLEQLIKNEVYNHTDLESSVALVAVSGNDYFTFLARNGTNATGQEWEAFITKEVNQIVVNVKRIRALGVKKIAVDSLQPVGCIPYISSNNSFTHCDNTTNNLVLFHNLLLQQAITTLNNETKDATYVYLDLYTPFYTILENHGRHQGRSEFVNTLDPCCKGTSSEYNCGSVDVNGVHQYTVCEQPDSSFFWDMYHPTQAAWRDVYLASQASLRQL